MSAYIQCTGECLTVERLSDGSMAIVDGRSKSVHSLNPTASLIWDASSQAATIDEIADTIEKNSGQQISSEALQQGLTQLLKANLIEPAGSVAVEEVDLGRRSMLKRATAAGAIAIPVVLSLTASEQKAYAYQALSGTTTTIPIPG